MKYFLLGFLVFLFFAGNPGHCAPDITAASWTGTLTKGTSVTFTCASCGTGPTMILYDDFENGVVGSSMTNGTAASYNGSWSTPSIAGFGPVYSTTDKFSGSKSMASDMTTNPASNGGEFYNQVFLSSATQVMICTDWRISGDWPGYGGTGANMKFNWIMNGNSTTDTDLYHGFSASGSSPPSGSVYDGNDTTFTKSFTANISSGTTWHQTCEWINGLAPGDIRFYDLSSTGTFRIAYTTTALTIPFLLDPGNQHTFWDRIHIPGFGRLMPGTVWYHDNVYVATGTASAAHIWIMDQPTIFASTKWAVAKIVSWSDTSVQIMVPERTQFSNAATVYAVACDSSFNCDTSGFPIIMDTSQGTVSSNPATMIRGVTFSGVTFK